MRNRVVFENLFFEKLFFSEESYLSRKDTV